MSFSCCLQCKSMVIRYEKYCADCEIRYKLSKRNDQNFWYQRPWPTNDERREMLENDGIYEEDTEDNRRDVESRTQPYG